MSRRGYFGLRIAGVVALLLIGMVIWEGCKQSSPPPTQPNQTPSQTGTVQPAQQPGARPDLMVSTIEVFPVQPQAGQKFAVNVYVTNAGQAPSSAYDLAMFIRDVSRGSTYPIGTFRKEALQPGESVMAYSSTDRLVNYPGSYQVHVEIRPFLFTDGNDQNNTKIWAFSVN